ncbi:MAG TPA: sodium:solute symporter family protein [Methylocella sp.]|nr:sodium:solute symporter family protein [Methylocella sp.]
MTTEIDWAALTVFVFLLGLVTILGFGAAGWRRSKSLAPLEEWGLGGRQFGTWITWFLIGGDIYTAYTMIAVPALVYATGAYGFFAMPYTILLYPFVFAFMPVLWRAAKKHNHVTAADVVYGHYGHRPLELAVALTGVVATMPYIALQLIGIETVFHALGIKGELPLVAAFLILALNTYFSGLRAPALIAIVKDTLIYIVIFAAILVIPLKLGGYGATFEAAATAFKARGSGDLLLAPAQFAPYVSLALGSALALFMYPHALTGVLASANADAIRKNAILLPAYSIVLAFVALMGLMGHAAGLKLANSNDVVPLLFEALFPGWFAGVAFAAIAIGALVPAAIMSIGAANLFTRNFWRAYINPTVSPGGEAKVAKMTSLALVGGALLFILYLPVQFALDLQLLGGLWILQTLPAVIFGLFTGWFRAPGLLAGWAAGFLGGSWLAWLNDFKPLHTLHFGSASITLYSGLIALVANILIATLVSTMVRRGLRNPARSI